MKQFITFLLITFSATVAFGQTETSLPPFKKHPSYPPAKLLMPDSSTYYTKDDLPKNMAVMVMLFNPDCEHCKHETEEIIKNIDQFKKIQIVMATMMPFDSMMHFRKKYGLANYKNIVVTKDVQYFLPVFFDVRSLPFLAFYNRKKELIGVHEGSMPIEEVLEQFKEAKKK